MSLKPGMVVYVKHARPKSKSDQTIVDVQVEARVLELRATPRSIFVRFLLGEGS